MRFLFPRCQTYVSHIREFGFLTINFMALPNPNMATSGCGMIEGREARDLGPERSWKLGKGAKVDIVHGCSNKLSSKFLFSTSMSAVAGKPPTHVTEDGGGGDQEPMTR